MSVVTWYRGFKLGVQPANFDSGGLHDIGDGIYFTRDIQTAREYAALPRQGDPPNATTMIYQVDIEMDRFRVLDLTADPRWSQYLLQRAGSSWRNVDLMKRSSEQYWSFFKIFCNQNGINLTNYDMVISDDFHSGGSGRRTVQMSLLYRRPDGYTTAHGEILSKLQLVEKNGVPVRTKVNPTLVAGGPKTTFGAGVPRLVPVEALEPEGGSAEADPKARRAAMGPATRNAKVVESAEQNSQAASLRWSGYAMGVAKLSHMANDYALDHRIREELASRKALVTAAFKDKKGVLVIVEVAQEKYSEAGFCAKAYQNIFLQPGRTPDEAVALWKGQPRMFVSYPGSAPYFFTEEYRWLDAGDEFE